jgi:diamine N-acetyltransferase
MIAREHQGRGYGRRALERLVEHVRGRPGAVRLGTSCVLASEGGPELFYRRFGFEATEEILHGERVLRLPL